MEIPEAPALQTVEDSSRKKQIANRHIKTRRSGRGAIDGWIWGILFRNRRWVWFWGTFFHNRAWDWFWWANIDASWRMGPPYEERHPQLVALIVSRHLAGLQGKEVLLQYFCEFGKCCAPEIPDATQQRRRGKCQLVNIGDS